MKKIYLAALTLAMTACVSNEDLNPVDNYGYIDVNVSNDPIVETRANHISVNGKNWYITIDGNTEYTGTLQAFEAGEYSIEVKSHETLEYATNTANESWGEAYYDNSANDDKVTVEAGKTANAAINCGVAQNARISVQFTEQFTKVFKTYSLGVKATDNTSRELTFDKTNNYKEEGDDNNKYAYFDAGKALTLTLKYDKNENSGSPAMSKEITNISMGSAGTEKIIKITANTHGNIQLDITTTDFGEPTTETLEFDAATGEQLTNQ